MNIPSHCPGISSESAGKSESCAGCPNQKFCQEAPKSQGVQDANEIKRNFSSVKNKIVIFSGKGGVGKSFLTCSIAKTLASLLSKDTERDPGVGILDLDICGPTVPIMMGMESDKLSQDSTGIIPAMSPDSNMSVASISYLIDKADPIVWRSNKKSNFIKDFLKTIIWDDLDFLLIDTPPGTSDEHISLANFLKEDINGALIITTPQELSWQDVRKEIDFCTKSGIPLIGIILNMCYFVCPCCNSIEEVLPNKLKEIEKFCAMNGTQILAKIPFDKEIARMCDFGEIRDDLEFIVPIANYLISKFNVT
jgi:Mrp family chromosome partitioning ATPase